jgi:hypothetical protein
MLGRPRRAIVFDGMRQDGLVSSHPAGRPVVGDFAVGPDGTSDGGGSGTSLQFATPEGNGGNTPGADVAAAATVVELDPAALDLARAAAVAEAGGDDHVGDFLTAIAEDDIAVTASFVARQPGYYGWQWSVTLALLTGERPTISEVVLLPREGALLAPVWIPWDERIRPGDVGVGDLLPPIKDDPRLVPAYVASDDPAVEAVALELGLGRVHVLSREGRIDFAERLHDGAFGPFAEMALAAPAHCFSCAFYLPLAGSLGRLTGACANEYSPADGHVVDADYGCGAHSETVLDMPARSAATDSVIDELSLEVHRRPASRAADPAVPDTDPAGKPSSPAIETLPPRTADTEPDGVPDDELVDLEPVDVEVADAEVAEMELDESDVAPVQVAPATVGDDTEWQR